MHTSRSIPLSSSPAAAPAVARQWLQDAVATVAKGSEFVALSLVFTDGTAITWPPLALPDPRVAAAAGREALSNHSVVIRRLHPGEHELLGVDAAIRACVALPLDDAEGAALTAWSSHPASGRTVRRAEQLALLLEGPARRHLREAAPDHRPAAPATTLPRAPSAGDCGSLAHELNNVVTALLLDAELLHGAVDADGPAAALVARLLQSSERAASLGTLLRMASGCGGGALDPVSLDRLGARIARAASVEDGGTVHFHAGPGPLRVTGDSDQLAMALRALLRNALAASQDAGPPVELSVDAVALLPDAAAAIGLAQGGRHVRVAVSDSGTGMDTDTLLRCTRPFFSTEDTHLGLGLAAARGLATSMGGALVVDSEVGEGTVVELWLPSAA